MTGPGASRGGHEPAADEPFVGRPRPYPPVDAGRDSANGSGPAPEAMTGPVEAAPAGPPEPETPPAGPSDLVPPAAPATPVRAVGRSRVPAELIADEESLAYVEGRPGQQLAENLAEQRRRELPTTRQAEQSEDAKRRVMPLWQELPLLLVVSFCVAVIVRSFLVQAFLIPSPSMEDLLREGDRVLVSKIVYDTRDPRRGEVVVFRGTERWVPESLVPAPDGVFDRIAATLGDLVGVSRPGEKDFIKRVIGLPGDRVACCDERGRVTVNGVGLDEPYLSSNNPVETTPVPGLCGARRFPEVIVPPGELFVMGDNRAVSQDSRCQGTIPIENVIGRAFFLVWPPGRWDGIEVPEYAGVPPPSV